MKRGNLARRFVLLATVVALAPCARPAAAQFLAPALDRPGFDRRLTQPSLRLSTLGGLSLVFADENNELNLWDFGGSSLGLVDDRDSTSLDVFFSSGSHSDKHTVSGIDREVDRGRGLNLGLQAVGRSTGKFAAGIDAGYLNAETGTPAQDGLYYSRSLTTPLAIPVLNGKLFDGKFGWGVRAAFTGSSVNNDLKTETVEDGEVKLSGGDLAGTTSPFELTDGKINANGLGFGVGWDPSKTIQVALNWDMLSNDLHGDNNTARRVYEVDEPQKSNEYSLTVAAQPSWLQVAAQIGRREYDSQQEYRYSQSGGLAGPPLVSRGDRLDRNYRQDWLRSRVSATPSSLPKLTVGADYNVRYDREQVDPATGVDNFNDFLVTIADDTLNLTPAVIPTLDELRHWNAGLGASYHVMSRLQVGLEAHRYNTATDGTAIHARRMITDVLAGAEYGVNPTWTARAGFAHRSNDQDVYTQNNESVSNVGTFGAGYAPPGSRFTLDAGFEIGTRDSNYPDPTETSGSLFRFVLYNRWVF